MVCTKRGTMLIRCQGKELLIENALCIDNVPNLLSVNQLVAKGFVLVFDKESVGVFASKDDVLVDKPFIQLERKMGNKLWTMEQPLEPVITSQ